MRKILIADDEADIIEVLRIRLELNGYAVAVASDGKECLEKIESEKPDLLILDIRMPDVDGYQVLETLKKSNFKLPVIVLTASALPKSKKLEGDKNVKEFITKPFKSEKILETIKKILG